MQDGTPEIAHVSVTELMTAACRALETERPDGLIRDPFAAQLAGERVMNMYRTLTPEQMPKPLSPGDPSGVHLFGRTP